MCLLLSKIIYENTSSDRVDIELVLKVFKLKMNLILNNHYNKIK